MNIWIRTVDRQWRKLVYERLPLTSLGVEIFVKVLTVLRVLQLGWWGIGENVVGFEWRRE